MYKNWLRYSTYPSSVKPAYSGEDIPKFPRGNLLDSDWSKNLRILEPDWSKIYSVTLCTNGIHSMLRIKENFPNFGEEMNINQIYTGVSSRVLTGNGYFRWI